MNGVKIVRNILALVAAITLSSSTGISVVACGNSSNTTTKIFDWNNVINGSNGETSDQLFNELLNNLDSGIGQTLYQDIVDYVSLSILKTSPVFSTDYAFAKQSVENQIKNEQDSLKAKYGNSWESKWNDFLKQPAQGGDGKTGSYQRYFDSLLKSKATTIVNNYYISDNQYDYQYYNDTEISRVWLNDVFNYVKSKKGTVSDYAKNGTFKKYLWVVEYAQDSSQGTDNILQAAINNASNVNDIILPYKVPMTINNVKPTSFDSPSNYIVDTTNSIKGLLSNQQSKIAQVWMKNKGPIWARQIVIPFNSNVSSKALQTKITSSDFSDSATTLNNVLNDIKTKGFNYALQSLGGITQASSSSTTGDLGLVTLDSDSSSIKSSFTYYLYRYVTSEQGIGSSGLTVDPYNIDQYTIGTNADYTSLINQLNRDYSSSSTSSSQYNDMVYINDKSSKPEYSGNGGDKVFAFIDTDGVHIVQTPGIDYKPTAGTTFMPNSNSQELITNFSQKLSSDKNSITWNDAAQVVNRAGGLENNPYLSFLATQYLYWQSTGATSFFDLDKSLSDFTSGSGDLTSANWWDYVLFFNNNQSKINWNLSNQETSTLLNQPINAPSSSINNFVSDMRSWFTTTANRRKSLEQSNSSNLDTLVTNINALNKTWDGFQNQSDVPPARMDATSLKYYINKVASETIWWYDPNNIYD